MKMFTTKIKPLNHNLLATISGALALFFLFSYASAASIYDSSVNAIVIPENPAPKTAVTIRLESPLVDLASANIVWFVNGKKVKEGKDVRILDFTLPETGQTKVEAQISSNDYGYIVKNFSFAPTLVEILYQANSFTPPFYKGKALIPPEGVVTLLAESAFKTSAGVIPARNLIYTWKKDGVIDGPNSGLGKNTYTYNNGRLGEDAPLIEVAVSSGGSSLRGNATFRVGSVQPEIIFYESNPLLGVMLNQKIPEDYFLNKQEITFVAYPYYFGGKNTEAEHLKYNWQISGSKVAPTGNSKTLLTVRKPEGKGASSVSLSLENHLRIFQAAKSAFVVQYDN